VKSTIQKVALDGLSSVDPLSLPFGKSSSKKIETRAGNIDQKQGHGSHLADMWRRKGKGGFLTSLLFFWTRNFFVSLGCWA